MISLLRVASWVKTICLFEGDGGRVGSKMAPLLGHTNRIAPSRLWDIDLAIFSSKKY